MRLINALLVVAGTLSLAIGVVGIVVPLLPTTPFLLLAAAAYLRGSPRMHRWLLGNRLMGKYIRDYREGRGVPQRVKVYTLCLLWAAIGYAAIFVVDRTWIRVLLLAVALAVTYHILTIETFRQGAVADH
jgi:uncharacterized membrane protein YbaN (DUF454 family)